MNKNKNKIKNAIIVLNKKYSLNIDGLFNQKYEIRKSIDYLKNYINGNIDINVSISFQKTINELIEKEKEIKKQIIKNLKK